jgi:hypothetical protein
MSAQSTGLSAQHSASSCCGSRFSAGCRSPKIPSLKYGAAVFGVVMLIVAVVRVCPVYSIFGLKTCA